MELTIEQALQQGVAAHKEGKLQDAERFYRAILQSQPTHPDANHNLGVLAVSLNKADAALPLFKTALEANPMIEQFWLSYIDALIKEQQFANAKQALEEAKKQGISGEKLNALEAQLTHINREESSDSLSPSQEQLSNLLEYYQDGRLGDSEKLAMEITQEFPEHQFGWKVLSAILVQTDRNSEAVDASQTAVTLSPLDADAHYNLGVTLQELGRLDDALASYDQAIVLNKKEPGYVSAYANLITYLYEACSAHFKLEKLWKESSVETGSGMMLPLAINRFLVGDIKGCRQILLHHYSGLSEPQQLELNNGKTYWAWLKFLLEWHAENPQNKNQQLPLKTLYVIGDSHSLAYHGINVKIGNNTFSCTSEWIWGCKQFHIGSQKPNKFKYKLDKLFSSLPPASLVLLSIGEIDCRLDNGIIPHCKKYPGEKIQRMISTTVENYLDYISEKSSAYLLKVIVQGIPCPNLDRATFKNQEIEELIELIQKFNWELKTKSISYGLGFLDLSTITNDSNGFSNGLWHADAYHITPDGVVEALRHYEFK